MVKTKFGKLLLKGQHHLAKRIKDTTPETRTVGDSGNPRTGKKMANDDKAMHMAAH